ncbi:hypothetical protein AAC387_Pa06g1175 [Persea americana]
MHRSSSPESLSCSSCCCWWSRGFVAFILKFLNFLEAFVGVSILLYSVWMLSHWNNHGRIPPPPSAPAPDNTNIVPLLLNSQYSATVRVPELVLSRKLGLELASGIDSGLQFGLSSRPAPWFIYSFMGIGISLCLVTCIGYIAVEANSGCCFSFHTMLTSIIIIFEAALVGFIAFNKHWDEDLPYDPTGQLDSLRSFIEDNIDVCKWVGLAVIVIQALSLLLSMILRAIVSCRTENYDSDDDYAVVRGGSWQPLINPQAGQSCHTSGSTSMVGKGIQPNTWNTRMKEKYGLNMSAFTYNH